MQKRVKKVDYYQLEVDGQIFEYRDFVNKNSPCFLYDGRDAFGKRKRICAATEVQLKEKIRSLLEENKRVLASLIPSGKNLQDYILYWFKTIVNDFDPSRYRKNMMLVSNSVFGSSIDKDIDTISGEELSAFFQSYLLTHNQEQLDVIKDALEGAFRLAAQNDIQTPDMDALGEYSKTFSISEYILAPKETETLERYCLGEGIVKYQYRIYPITFALLSGLSLLSVSNLTAEDFFLDEEEPYVTYALRPSTSKKHKMPLDERCVEWLRKMEKDGVIRITSYTNQGAYVFHPAHGDTAPYGCVAMTSNIRTILGLLGLPNNINQNSFRKAMIIRRIYGGWSNQKVVETYNLRRVFVLQQILDEFHNQQEMLGHQESD